MSAPEMPAGDALDDRERAIRREMARLRRDPAAVSWGGLRFEAELIVYGVEP